MFEQSQSTQILSTHGGAGFHLDTDDTAVTRLQDQVDRGTVTITKMEQTWPGLGPLGLGPQFTDDERLDEASGQLGVVAEAASQQSRSRPGSVIVSFGRRTTLAVRFVDHAGAVWIRKTASRCAR